jgi:hypothetical protein
LLVVPSLPASAQSPQPSTQRFSFSGVDFGWFGTIPSERWTPITVWIDPGDKALEGTVTCEFQQDGSQDMRIVAPFVATPGRQNPVEFVAALPAGCDHLTITALSAPGRFLGELIFRQTPRRDELQLPVPMEVGLFASVGDTSLMAAGRDWSERSAVTPPASASSPRKKADSGDPDPAWGSARAVRIAPDHLPLSWPAYDSLVALIVTPESASAADPRAIAAIHDWVRSGGRLVILANTSGATWRAWLPLGPEGDFVEPADIQRSDLPPAVQETLSKRSKHAKEPERFSPALTPTFRPLRLTAKGRDDGWTLRWPTGPESPDRPGALAEGPLGFGWVTVLGLDPRDASGSRSSQAIAAIWENALGVAAADWVADTARPRANPLPWMPATDPNLAATVSACIDRIARVPDIGASVFYGIAASIAGLATLLGPIDFFFLRRFHQSHRSWLTATAWIALASLAAYTVPRFARAGATTLGRLTATDVLSGASATQADSTAFQTALTVLSSGQSGDYRPADSVPSAFFRGISPLDYDGRRHGSGQIRTTQGPHTADSSGRRNAPIDSLPMGIWTIRTMLDESFPTETISGTLIPEGDDLLLTVRGLPPIFRTTDAALRIANTWYTVTLEPGRGAFQARVTLAHPLPTRPPTWTPAFEPSISRAPQSPDHGNLARPGIALSLPASRRRDFSLEQRLLAGRWAALYVEVQGLPTDFTLAQPAETSRIGAFRLLMPLPPGVTVPSAPPPSEGSTP